MDKQREKTIGFIGLGAMGAGMAMNLLRAGKAMKVFDIVSEKMQQFSAAGAVAADSIADLVSSCDVIMTSLPSAVAMVDLAGSILIPGAANGQIFIDLGTITAPQARELGRQFTDKGAFFLDAPVSGGPSGAAEGSLYVFIGGDPDVAGECLPLFRIIGNADHVVYCGASGSGQIVKGVNQMAMGLGAAAHLEAIAFGVRAGVSASIINDAIGGTDGWRGIFARVARQIADGKGDEIGVKHGQLPYFMEEAAEKGFELPMTKALYTFCEHAEKKIMEANRLSPSFWDELINRSATDKSVTDKNDTRR